MTGRQEEEKRRRGEGEKGRRGEGEKSVGCREN
jgi:hypothetical protein